MQKNVKTNCTSSVYLETNHLKLLCYIDGPIYQTGNFNKAKTEDSNKMDVQVKINIPSYYKNVLNNFNNLEKQLENLFEHNILLDKYARTKLQINIDVYEYSCDILSFCVMAISLALTYANIEQKGIVTCANIITKDGEIIVDPTLKEEESADFKLNFGCIVDLHENNLFLQKGTVDEEILKKVNI